MKRISIFFIAAAILLAIPVASEATTPLNIADLESQVASLMQKVNELQQIIKSLREGIVPPVKSHMSCSPMSHTFYIGRTDAATGGDVTKLQTFLTGQGYFRDEITGVFGTSTEVALKNWQTRNNIVASGTASTTGFGLVGPRTRAAINRLLCPVNAYPGGAGTTTRETEKREIGTTTKVILPILPKPVPLPLPTPSGALKAYPESGNAPLVVRFEASVGQSVGQYYVSFGDGTESVLKINEDIDSGNNSGICVIGAGGPCNSNLPAVSHTYEKSGSYTAMLYTKYTCDSGTFCLGIASKKLGEVVIKVE